MKKISNRLAASTIKNILSKKKIIVTLKELHFLVNRDLKKHSLNYSISMNRLKNLVLDLEEVEVRTKNRKNAKKRNLKKCPVCNKELKKVFGKNLFGKMIHIGYKCKKCSYNSSLFITQPREYIFIWKNKTK